MTSANWRSRYSLRSARFLELVDGRQVHLAQLLEVGARAVRATLPRPAPPHRRRARAGFRPGRSAWRRTARRCLRGARAIPALPGAPASIALARGVDALSRHQALLVERAQRAVGFFERATLGRQLGFDSPGAAPGSRSSLPSRLDDRQVAVGQRRFELGAAHSESARAGRPCA